MAKDVPDDMVFTASIWTRKSPLNPGLSEILPSGNIFRSDDGAAFQNRRLYWESLIIRAASNELTP